MTVATAASPRFLDRFLAWLRQGSTQAGLQAIGLSALGCASHATPLWTLVVAVPVGIVGMLWPEQPAVQREAQALATDAVRAAAAADPRVGAALGLPAAALPVGAVWATPAAGPRPVGQKPGA